MLSLCEPRSNTHTLAQMFPTHTYARLMHHTAPTYFSGCDAPALSGPGRVLSMRTTFHLLICGRTSGVCLPPSQPLTLNPPCLRHHAPRAAAEVCQSAWPLGGPLTSTSGLGTCCQVGNSPDLNDAMKLVDNVIRRYHTITSPPI